MARSANNAETRALRAAFMAGFCAAGEGWNGEYPFDCDLARIDTDLAEEFHEWLATRPQGASNSDSSSGGA